MIFSAQKLTLALMASGLGLMIWGGISLAQQPDDKTLLGGQTTIHDASMGAFQQPIPALETLDYELFRAGELFFYLYWTTTPVTTTHTDGLAPLFNARSCSSCHFNSGRGRPAQIGEEGPFGLIARLSISGFDAHGDTLPDPTYGHQLQDQPPQHEGILSVTYTEISGTYADGTPYTLYAPIYQIDDLGYGDFHPEMMFSPRLATQLIGLGLLEAISDETLLALADPDDLNGDGISGRVNWVWDSISQREAIGRFGWKATQPNLTQQVGLALLEDMGITSPFLPRENCTQTHPICDDNPMTEMSLKDLLEVVIYVSTLAVPAQREADNPLVLQGAAIFDEIGCAACHVSPLTTGKHPSIGILSNQTIYPYTDLLLHDMGAGVADGRPDFAANGQEWRTPPLWGIGLFEAVMGYERYLHDGRARTLEEAILWHGGEAAASQAAFIHLTAQERAALIGFLKSL